MVVVSDTSVLSGLIKLEQIDLLQLLFTEIIIPPTVKKELQELTLFGYDLSDFFDNFWIKIVHPTDTAAIEKLEATLDKGEAEAIILAIQLKADFLLVDERKGRTVAENLGLKVTGLIGILLKAKQNKLIEAIKPVLDELIEKKFRIHPQLYQKVLETAGE